MANWRHTYWSEMVSDSATVTTGGTENTTYPLTNAVDFSQKNIPNPSKLTGTSGDVILDFGSAQRVDLVVIWHNLDASLAYSVQMNATNSWGGPTVNVSATAPAKRKNGYTYKVHHDLVAATGYSAGGFRYLRINVTGTNSVPVGLKVLAFSAYHTTVRNIRWGWARDITQTGIGMQTDARVKWGYDLTAAPRIFRAEVPGTDADYASILNWVDECAGTVNPTVVIPNPGVNDAWLGYMSSGSPGVQSPSLDVYRVEGPYQFTNVNPIAFALEEITAGDPEWY